MPHNTTAIRGARDRQVLTHPTFMLAAALDPRTKHLEWAKDTDNKHKMWDDVLSLMIDVATSKEDEDEKNDIAGIQEEKTGNKRKAVPRSTTRGCSNPLSKHETRLHGSLFGKKNNQKDAHVKTISFFVMMK